MRAREVATRGLYREFLVEFTKLANIVEERHFRAAFFARS